MADNQNNQLEEDLIELRAQVALLTRYVRVLQDKVKELNAWKLESTPQSTRGFSDFGPPRTGSLGSTNKSLGDIAKNYSTTETKVTDNYITTNYPIRPDTTAKPPEHK